ncbi:hypothetical protein Efla_001904 [Eimeria flavescens]
MDASDLFSISARQPARMPPDIKELPPISRGRSDELKDRASSPSGSPDQSRRRSVGCSMRTVKEERQQTEPELRPEGVAVDVHVGSDHESPGSLCGASQQERSVSSTKERSGRHRESHGADTSSSRRSSCNASCGPLPTWDEFFEKCEDVKPRSDSDDTFRVYTSGSSGPLLFLLHGAGHTALSWACFARLLRDGSPPLRLFAYDARGHGATQCTDSTTLSAEALTEDGIAVVQYLYDRLIKEMPPQQTQPEEGRQAEASAAADPGKGEHKQNHETDSLPSVILVGHSMGGAIATRMAASGRVPQLHGLMVLDVVEGTALAALPQMAAFVSRFPSLFTSCKEAVNWSIFAGLLCNRNSAAISIPSQLVKTTRGALPAGSKGADKGPPDEEVWTWRVDLMATERYWEGWFRGMSQAFLSSRCVKILICSSSDRLDKELMIAHMQGKFQVQIVSGSGHVIEEDQPAELCRVVQTFVTRYRLHLPPSQRAGVLRG